MKTPIKALFAAVAATMAFVATADDPTVITADGVEVAQGAMTADGNAYTATSLEYFEPGDGDELNRGEAGWYVGLRRTWALSYTGSGLGRKYTGAQASSTKASLSDNAGNSIAEYGVYNLLGALTDPDNSPEGCGIRNRFQSGGLGGLVPYMLTTDWSVCVTPALLKSFSEIGEPYVATLTVGGETYTITVPFNTVLRDANGEQVYPELPKHDHLWKFEVGETSVTARCEGENTCSLCGDGGSIAVALEAVGDMVKFCGSSIEAQLAGAEVFAATGAEIGEIEYYTAAGARLDAAPSEVGEYEARVAITVQDHDAAEATAATLRLAGFEVLAGEAVMDGVHVKDAADYLEKATGSEMEILAGRSYTAEKTYVVPEKYGILELLTRPCGPKTYDLAGFRVAAPAGGPLFENRGTLVIRDTSEGRTGAILPNSASQEDTVVVNYGTLAIDGGTFYGAVVNAGGSISISGGLFAVKPDESFVAEGCDLVRRGNMWSVEPHTHNYRFVTLAGSRVVLAVCVDVFAENSLQLSHCPARVMVGVVGLRQSILDAGLGLVPGDLSALSGILELLSPEGIPQIPQLSVDYDRKEHPAEFYAFNLTAAASALRNQEMLEFLGKLAQTALTSLSAEESEELFQSIIAFISDNFDAIQSLNPLGKISDIFVDSERFAKETGVDFAEMSYLLDNEPFDGIPVEPGRYAAIQTFVAADGKERQVRGDFTINEKELPIETDHAHNWSFAADGARVVATCNGGFSTESLLTWVDHCNVSPMSVELVPSVEGGRKEYDAVALSVEISNKSTFEINTGATVSDVTYRTKDGEPLEGPPVEPGEYQAEIVVAGVENLLIPVTRTATIDLVIDVKIGTGEFPNGSFRVLPSQTGRTWGAVNASGETANVLNGRNLDYDADAEAWTANMAIDWPSDLNALSPTPRYTDEEHVIVEADGEYSLVTGKFLSIPRWGFIDFVSGVLWSPSFTLDDAFAALDAGETTLKFEITVGSNGWRNDLEGLRATTYILIVPLDGLVLRRGNELVDVMHAYDIYVNTHTVSGLPTDHALVKVDEDEVEVSDNGTIGVYTGKTISVQPWDGFFATRFLVDGDPVEADDDGVYSFTMADSDIAVDCEIVHDIGNEDYVSVTIDDLAYTGEALEPVVEVVCSIPEDFEVTEGEDFTVAYFDAEENEVGEIVDAGEYTAVLTGIGKFGGTRTATFAVVDYAALFDAYKTQKIAEAEGLAAEGDSDACAALISGATDAIAAIEYDSEKTLDELKAEVDAIVTQLATDLATQRAADAEAAKQAAFADYKDEKIAEAEGLAAEGDSDACAALISGATDAIAAIEYDSEKTLDELKAEVDAIVTQLATDLATQRAADAEAAKQSAFADYKDEKITEAEGLAAEGDSDACAALISGATDAIAAIEYDSEKTLDELKAEVDAIVAQLATDLATQRAADADAANLAAFADYKDEKIAEAEGLAAEGDSDACAALISGATDAIAALEYDSEKTLDELKAEVDAIVTQLATDLAIQRAIDEGDANAAAFADYKNEKIAEVGAMSEDGDSDACAGLIADAQAAIAALEYDSEKTLDELKAEVDAIVTQLATDLAIQRAIDEGDANAAAFADYKDEKIAEVGAMSEDGDSDACAGLIADAQAAIAALEYDSSKTLDELKAEVDAIVTQLATDLAIQRAIDAGDANAAAFADYKDEKIAEAGAMSEDGDSDACAGLIADAQAAIAALEYDSEKTLDELKAEVDAIVAQLATDLATQRAADAEAANQAAFADYKDEKIAEAEGLAAEGDSDACAALISAATDAIAALEYDSTKTLDELQAEVDAIVAQLADDLAAQRAADAEAAKLVLFKEVTGTVNLSKASKWTAYLRDEKGDLAAVAAITVGKLQKRKGVSKVKVVVRYPGVSKRVNIVGKMDPSGILTVGNDVLTFGADAVKGRISGCEVDGARNIFASSAKPDRALAKAALPSRKGNYTVAWGDATNGWTAASVRIGAKGKAKISGWQPNGKKVSASGQLAIGDVSDCISLVSTNKTSPLAVNIWFLDDGSLVVEGTDPALTTVISGIGKGILSPATLSTELLKSDIVLISNNRKLVSDNPKAKVSVAEKTGRMTGSVKVGRKNASIKGYVVDGVGYGFVRFGKLYIPLTVK